MKLSHIRNLVTVAQRGGLRRAARHLGLAQPALTRSIRELEHELGATLFQRDTMGMVLTPIGEAFFKRSVAVQLELERACDEVRQLQGLATGTVSIGLSTVPHLALLPSALEPFQRRYPEVLMKITEGLFPAMEGGLRSGQIDFYVGPLSDRTLTDEFIGEKLFDNRRVVMARPGHPLAGARSLDELSGARWLSTSVTLNHETELKAVFVGLGLPPPKVAVQASSALSMISVAASTDLLVMLPQQWLEFARTTHLLQRLQLREQLAAPSIYIVTRSPLPHTPAAEYLADLLRRAASSQTPEGSTDSRALSCLSGKAGGPRAPILCRSRANNAMLY